MAYHEGSSQYFAYKVEGTPNTEESGSGGTILRRITGQLTLNVAKVTSAEKTEDFQERTVNHGTRSVSWNITGPLVGADYQTFMAASLRRDFTAPGNCTGAFTIVSGVLTRATGSFLADGVRVGDVRRLAAMTTTANLARNIRVTSVASDGLTCGIIAIDGGDPIADDSGTNASATFNMPGKVTYAPSTSLTKKTITLEKYSSASDTSQIARGNKVGLMEVNVQPDQESTIAFSGMGIDRRNVASGAAPVLTSPTASGTGDAMSAGIGFVRVNGAAVAAITGMSFSVDGGMTNQPVAFANTSPDIFYGKSNVVQGTITLVKDGNTISNLYDDETEVELDFYTAAPGPEPRAFISFYLARAKLFGDDETDPDGPVIQTVPFHATKKKSGTGYDLTVLKIQDSQAT